jgi:uncharacterized RDD family membrane protein YckC
MQPIDVPESNKTLTAPLSMDDCGELKVCNNGRETISCWQFESWRERLGALFYGTVWVRVVAGPSSPPIAVHAGKTVFTDV